jgi:predicted alpha/beta-fold hydrolase
MDMRGCGAGVLMARLPYHSGLTSDVVAVLAAIEKHCTSSDGRVSPVTIAGFSLGGNIALKLAGELQQDRCHGFDSVVAVCPPIDLAVCSLNLQRRLNRLYDRHFLRALMEHVTHLRQHREDAPQIDFTTRPRTMADFDDRYTAPLSGFSGAHDYYSRCSARLFTHLIRRPTLILSASDDPLTPATMYNDVQLSPTVDLHLTRRGGHLGFVARRGIDADNRWMDWRVVDWICAWDKVSSACDLAHTV